MHTIGLLVICSEEWILSRYASDATIYYKQGRPRRVDHRWLCGLGVESINML